MSYFIFYMSRYGADVIVISSVVSTFLMLVTNLGFCYGAAFNPEGIKLAKDTDVNECGMDNGNYLTMKGMDVLHTAHLRLAGVNNVTPGKTFLDFKNKAVNDSLVETFFLHFVGGLAPI